MQKDTTLEVTGPSAGGLVFLAIRQPGLILDVVLSAEQSSRIGGELVLAGYKHASALERDRVEASQCSSSD